MDICEVSTASKTDKNVSFPINQAFNYKFSYQLEFALFGVSFHSLFGIGVKMLHLRSIGFTN